MPNNPKIFWYLDITFLQPSEMEPNYNKTTVIAITQTKIQSLFKLGLDWVGSIKKKSNNKEKKK